MYIALKYKHISNVKIILLVDQDQIKAFNSYIHDIYKHCKQI